MCGILGYYLFKENYTIDDSRFIGSLRMMSHRGPDDEGVWKNPGGTLCLGHRRLSIIDLSDAAHQPMISENGRYIITYNGEIYNYRDLNTRLKEKNFSVRSSSDTETLLNAYELWGEDCLKQFRGMFAFAIYDKNSDSLFIARDRMGIKPFYYTVTDKGFFFSSEIKPLFGISGIKKELRKESAYEYFAFGKVHSPFTIFENVFKLPSAHCARIDSKGISTRKYWTPYDDKIDFISYFKESDYEKKLFDLFCEAVDYRLVSDVPVGIFLSGGVDSTGILGMIKYLGKNTDVYTYSAGFKDAKGYDERHYAKKAADYFGTRHHEILITKEDFTDSFNSILQPIDEPRSDSTLFPIYFLSKLAKENGSIVILNGDGADELFAGYNKWLEYIRLYKYWNIFRHSPNFIKKLIDNLARISFKGQNKQILKDNLFRAKINTQFYIGDTGALKGTDIFEAVVPRDIYRIFDNNFEEFKTKRNSSDYVEWMSYWGLKSMVENIFLYRADRMGMANSIEIRVPYIDHKLVEFGLQIPQGLKYKNGVGKYILKKSLERIVPGEFLYRKKTGFCVPVKEWVGEKIRLAVFPYFFEVNKEINLFSNQTITELENLAKSGKSETGETLLLNLYVFLNWYRNWFE